MKCYMFTMPMLLHTPTKLLQNIQTSFRCKREAKVTQVQYLMDPPLINICEIHPKKMLDQQRYVKLTMTTLLNQWVLMPK